MPAWTMVVQPCGGGTMNVHDIAPDGRIVGGSDMQGVYLTGDRGDHWQIRNRGLGAFGASDNIASIMWSATESNTIYAATGDAGSGGGLMASTDGAGTWKLRTASVQFAGNHTAAPLTAGGFPRSTGRLLQADGTWLWAATYATGVKRSAAGTGQLAGADNFPVTFTFAGSAPGTGTYFCRCLFYDPAGGNLYTGQISSGSSGQAWKCTAPAGGSPDFTKLTASPATVEDIVVIDGMLYAACGPDGIYKSPDGGTTWTSLNSTVIDTQNGGGTSWWNGIDAAVDPNGTTHYIVAVCGNPKKVTGGAVSLVMITIPSHGTGTAAYTPLDPTKVTLGTLPPDGQAFWASAAGVCLGNGGGVNFNPRFDPNDATRQKVSVSGSFGFYRSSDRGVNWQIAERGANQFPVRGPLATDPLHANHVVFGDTDWGGFDIADGIGYANTAGSMQRSTAGAEGRACAIDPVDSTVYMAIGTKYSVTAGGDVKQRAWNQPTSYTSMGLGSLVGGKVATGLCAFRDASNNKIVLAAVQGSAIWRWNGSAWSQTSGGAMAATQPVNTVFAYAGGGVVYIYDKNNGVYRSTDYGTSWTLIMAPADGAAKASVLRQCQVAANPAVPGELWVIAPSNVFRLNNAQTGTVGGGGITKTAITDAKVSGGAAAGAIAIAQSGMVVLSTNDTGNGCDNLSSTDGGTTWTTTQPDFSYAGNCDQAFRLAFAADGRLYGLGSNNLQWTYPGQSSAGLSIQTTSLPDGVAGQGYSAALAAQNGTPPYAWTSTGTLPPGVTLNSAGQFSGTPTTAGTYSFTVTVADAAQGTASAPLSILINSVGSSGQFTSVQNGANIVGTSGTVGLYFSQAGGAPSTVGTLLLAKIACDSGSATITGPSGWALADDSKSGNTAGVARAQIWAYLNNPGNLAGTAATAAAFTSSETGAVIKGEVHEFAVPAGMVQVSDRASGGTGHGSAAAGTMTVTGSAANSQTGGLATAAFMAKFSASTAGGAWTAPSGWLTDANVASAAVSYSGFYQTAIAGSASTATAGYGPTANMTAWAGALATFYAQAASPPLLTTTSLPQGTVGQAYQAQLSASGGIAPYTYSVTGLPAGLSASTSGLISGTPTAAATVNVSAGVTDSIAQHTTTTLSLSVAAAPGSGVFTKTQVSGGLTGTGSVACWFSQTGGVGSTAGSLLVAKLVTGETGTVTAPSGWALAADSGAHGGARTLIYAYPANPGSLGASATSGQQTFTCQNGASVIKGRLAEWSTPASYVQYTDQAATAGQAAAPSATWTRVQVSPLSTTGTATLPAASAAGNLLLAHASAASATAITGPAGWTQIGSTVTNGSLNETSLWAYYNNPGSITAVTFGGPASMHVAAAEFTCPNVSSVTTTSSTGTNTAASGTSLTVTTGAGAAAGDLVAAAFFEHLAAAGALTWTTPTGFQNIAAETGNIANHAYSCDQLTAAASGAQAVTATSSVTSATTSGWTGIAATFSPPASTPLGTTLGPAACASPNTMPGGIASAMAAAAYSPAPAAQTWPVPSGWADDGHIQNSLLGYDSLSQNGITTGPTSVAPAVSTTTNLTGYAVALATFYAQNPTPPSPLAITTTSLPAGVVAQAYSAQLAASGGTPPYTWQLAGGVLP